jgi:predicted Zn-dependent protease
MKRTVSVALTVLACLFMITTGVFASQARVRVSSGGNDFSDTKDIESEIVFGRDLAARILANYHASKDNSLIRYVNLVGKGLSLFSGRPELRFRFIVLETEEINAFATPGGYIFITTGALKHMDNEAQLACVIGHEIAHVTLRHVVRRFNIRGDDSSAFSALTGAVGSNTAAIRNTLEQAMDGASAILFEKGYSLNEELEADAAGVQIASAAGYDAGELNVFLKSCDGFEKKDASYKGDHPQLDVRIESIRKTLTQIGYDPKNAAKARRRFYATIKK